MGFQLGPIADLTDTGKLHGVQKEIACKCWFTSTGTTIPLMIKIMDDEGQIYSIQVLQVISSDEKRFCGIETVEHVCKILVNEQEKIVKLVFNKSSCTWKIVFL